MKNKTGRKILTVATVLAIVAGSIAVVSAEGILENGITYSAVAIHDDPSSNHDIVNATLSEYTSAIYNRVYKENAVDKKSTPGQIATILSSSVTILDHTMCKAVDEDSNPIDRTSGFYTTDRYASLWYKLFVPKNLGYNGTVRWYDPDGNLEEEWTNENQARSLSYEVQVLYNFFIAGNPRANKTGNWHVIFYLNGVKKFTEYFTISNHSTPTHSSLTIYVPDDYALIQDAVDAASRGDTIIVREGTYEENIAVYKRLTIRSENGSDSTVVQADYPDLPVFKVAADYVNISGFTVKGANEDAGIYLYAADYCTISNNICSGNEDGILLIESENNSVSNNVCSDNGEDGIRVYTSDNNNISDNNSPSNNCSISLTYSANNSVSGNVCSYNSVCGIFIAESTNNIISNNHCTYNFAGIALMNSSDNCIFKNNCSENDRGIVTVYANNNDIYLNNFMNNDVNADSYESSNTCSSPSKITYTYNGKTYTNNYLGNYWDDYSRLDNDNDGIGDSSYRIDGNRDRYPLMKPWEKYF